MPRDKHSYTSPTDLFDIGWPMVENDDRKIARYRAHKFFNGSSIVCMAVVPPDQSECIIDDDSGVAENYDTGADAAVTVNGQQTAVDGESVHYTGNGVGVTFELGTLGAGSSTTLTVKGQGGATFQLGTNATTRATIGIDGVYTDQLGTASLGYLASLGSGKGNSLLDDPSAAAEIAREAKKQVSELQGRIGGFQRFQVQTSLNSLNESKVGLEKAKGVIRDVDYAVETAELNRLNVLIQSTMSLLGLANQHSANVLALLR